MINPIDEVNATTTQAANPELIPHTALPHTPASTTDGVALSEAAQAKLLEKKGLSVAEIADQLGLAANVVLEDLQVTITSSAQAGVLAASTT